MATQKKTSSATKPERVEIGFSGGQVLATKLAQKPLTDLRKALEKPEGWHEVKTDEGELAIDLAQVVFVKVAGGEHSIGFGG